MSYDVYLGLGETKHHEYYDGLLYVNLPSRRHVVVARRLTRVLEDSCPSGFEVYPEWGWHAAAQQDFEPDVMVASQGAPGDDMLRAAPLLVVEVTSRSTRREDWGRKREVYAQAGAGWYWIVDLEADQITVMRGEHGQLAIVEVLSTGTHRLSEPFPVVLDVAALLRR
jgi:Uma2 family endonuclease